MPDSQRIVIDTDSLRELARYLNGSVSELAEIRLDVLKAKVVTEQDPALAQSAAGTVALLDAIGTTLAADHSAVVDEVLRIEAEEGAPVSNGAAPTSVVPSSAPAPGSAGGALSWAPFRLAMTGAFAPPPSPWNTAWVTAEGTVALGDVADGFGHRYDDRAWTTVFEWGGSGGLSGGGTGARGLGAGASGLSLLTIGVIGAGPAAGGGGHGRPGALGVERGLAAGAGVGLTGAGASADVGNAGLGSGVSSPDAGGAAAGGGSVADAPSEGSRGSGSGDGSGSGKKTTKPFGTDLPDNPVEMAKSIADKVDDFKSDPLGAGKDLAESAKEIAESFAGDPVDSIKDLAEGVTDAAERFADDPLGAAEDLSSSLRELAKETMLEAGTAVGDVVQDGIGRVGAYSDFENLTGTAAGDFADLTKMSDVGPAIGGFLDDPAGTISTGLGDAASSAFGDDVGEFLDDPASGLADGFRELVDGGRDLSELPGDLGGELAGGVERFADGVDRIGERFSDPAATLGGVLESVPLPDGAALHDPVTAGVAGWANSPLGSFAEGLGGESTSDAAQGLEGAGTEAPPGGADVSPVLNSQAEVPSAGVDVSPVLNPQAAVPSVRVSPEFDTHAAVPSASDAQLAREPVSDEKLLGGDDVDI